MLILRHHDDLPDQARGGAVALGNFDGLHRGHQAVITTAVERARAAQVQKLAVTFEPHPRRVFQPDIEPFRLTSFRTKARHMEALGIDTLLVLHFDRTFSQISAEAFVRDILVTGLGAGHVVVGYDFVFGNRRRGDTALLAQMSKRLGFGFTVVDAVKGEAGEAFSSTAIRQAFFRH